MRWFSVRAFGSLLALPFFVAAAAPFAEGAFVLPDPPPFSWQISLHPGTSFYHKQGRPGGRGWQLDHKDDREGYALSGSKPPLLLQPGLHRVSFTLRRGHYPEKGLLNSSYALFRLEMWDVTVEERVASRELQLSDFPEPNVYVPRWMTFSTRGREGHAFEPRVYWLGLANGEIGEITISRFEEPNMARLHEKAQKIGKRIEADHLENGFVVSRKPKGAPDEIGDASTYTGFYAAALAWRLQATKDPLAREALGRILDTLHDSILGTEEDPILSRYINEKGDPFPKSPSKDVYTAFFLAGLTAHAALEDGPIKERLTDDISSLGYKFLEDGLTVRQGRKVVMSLAPYFTEYEIRHGIEKLFTKKDEGKKILRNLRTARRIIPFTELFPTMDEVINALKKQDQDRLFALVIPTLNGMADLVERARNVLREQFREDLFPLRKRNNHYPGRRLQELLTKGLNNFPPKVEKGFSYRERFQRLSDFSVLGSNALISLHMLKTAETLSGEPAFEEYLNTNLYTQDALLQTALLWFNFEEDFIQLTAGNPSADQMRKGYLSAISLMSLIEQETNPAIREHYLSLLSDWWEDYRFEDNAMAAAFQARAMQIAGVERTDPAYLELVDLVQHALDSYPESPDGLGPAFWKKHGLSVAESVGGGEVDGHSREALPVSHRPRDSFIWQRNARRLKGDARNAYPGTDYLFVYWFSRLHGIIPEPTYEALVEK